LAITVVKIVLNPCFMALLNLVSVIQHS